MKNKYEVKIEIPKNAEVFLDGDTVKIKGQKGNNERTFLNPRIEILKENNFIVVRTKKNGVQNDKVFINTLEAHLKNMFKGVLNGYSAKVKICSGHFPMQVKVEGNFVSIKNFLGEKIPRKANIMLNTKVEVKGDIIEINGIDKEMVSQTAANIEQSTRITNRDRRVFQDGCYVIFKTGEVHETKY